MRCFCTICGLRIKSLLHTTAFLLPAAVFLLLIGIFGVILPQNSGSSMKVGLVAQGELAQQLAEKLQENTDYTMLLFETPAQLERQVLNGTLHCGYLLSEDLPFYVYQTDASYMHPLVDELVLSTYFQIQMPQIAADYLEQGGFDATHAAEHYVQLAQTAPPMQILLHTVGTESLQELEERSLQPLFYAVLCTLFLGMVWIQQLLTDSNELRLFQLMKTTGNHPILCHVAPLMADAICYLVLLFLAEAIASTMLGDGYSLAAKMLGFLLLTGLGLLLMLIFSYLRRWKGFAVWLLPLVLLSNVLFSGAILNPSLLPAGISVLRFVAPAWYFLQLLTNG